MKIADSLFHSLYSNIQDNLSTLDETRLQRKKQTLTSPGSSTQRAEETNRQAKQRSPNIRLL